MARQLRQILLASLLGVMVAVMLNPLALAEQRRRPARTGFIEVVSLTEGAEVYVDGEQVGNVPLPEKIVATTGEHSVKVSKRGFTQHLEVVAVKVRQTTTVEADLLALAGLLRIEATNVEEARVFIDDDYVGNAPLETETEPGQRHIRMTLAGYYDYEEDVEVVAGEEASISAELERLPPEIDPTIPPPPPERHWYERWWVWTIIGTVVVATAVAVPVGITQRSDYCEDLTGVSCDQWIRVSPGE